MAVRQLSFKDWLVDRGLPDRARETAEILDQRALLENLRRVLDRMDGNGTWSAKVGGRVLTKDQVQAEIIRLVSELKKLKVEVG